MSDLTATPQNGDLHHSHKQLTKRFDKLVAWLKAHGLNVENNHGTATPIADTDETEEGTELDDTALESQTTDLSTLSDEEFGTAVIESLSPAYQAEVARRNEQFTRRRTGAISGGVAAAPTGGALTANEVMNEGKGQIDPDAPNTTQNADAAQQQQAADNQNQQNGDTGQQQ